MIASSSQPKAPDRASDLERLVAERTEELREANAALRAEVAQRQKAEESLGQREAQLRFITDHSPVYLVHCDRDYRYRFVNDGYARRFGLRPEQVVGRTIPAVVGPAAFAAFRAYVDAALAGRGLDFEVEIPYERLGPRWMHCVYAPEVTESGAVVGMVAVLTDVTARKRSEQAHYESEARFRNTFEQAAVGIAHVGFDGRWLRVNRRLCDIVGYSHEELLTRTFQDITHPDDLEADLSQMRRVLAGEIATYSMEKRYFHKGGAVVWVNLTISLVREDRGDEAGAPAYFIAVVQDISDRKAVETALRESEQRFAQFMRHLPGLAWVKDGAGRYTYVNEAAEAAFAAPRAMLYGKTDDEVFPPQTAAQFRANDDRVREDGSAAQVIETVAHPDGVVHHSIVSKFPIPAADGGPPLVGGVAFDVTDRIRAEEELRALNATLEQRVAERTIDARLRTAEAEQAAQALQRQTTLLEAILDSMAEGVIVADLSGRVTHTNPASRLISGRGPADCGPDGWSKFYGVFLPDGVTPFPTDRLPLFLALMGHESQDVEMVLRNPDCPEGRTVHVTGRPIRDRAGKPQGGMVSFHDVSHEKRSKEALARSNAGLAAANVELTRSNAELEQFAYVASHDLQEPLRMVASYMQLLAERYRGRLDERADKYIGYAVDGATRMQALIDDLLTYSRVGRAGTPFGQVDLAAVVDRAAANLRPRAEQAGGTVTRDDLPPVWGDERQLTQLFQNLIGNALKFCQGRAPSVHVGAERGGAGLTFFVRDNGIGIAPEHRQRIFAIFQRLHTRAEYPGTGIGLAICRKVVERHGGRIWVESRPGEGSVFRFTISPREDDSHDD